MHFVWLTEKSCGNAPDIVNTTHHTVGEGLDATAIYNCLDGFKKMEGDNSKSCEDQIWIGDDLLCIG